LANKKVCFSCHLIVFVPKLYKLLFRNDDI
jgi:hypothetical protein